MANSRRRCSVCGAYKRQEDMAVTGIQAHCLTACEPRQRSSPSRPARPSNDAPSEVRKAVRARDRGCVWCGSTRDLQVHHVAYRSQGGGHEMHNLVTLCERHHRAVHADKPVYQPLLRAYIWTFYVTGVRDPIPTLARRLPAMAFTG